MKVLLVDDEYTLVEMLKEILRKNNIDCDSVYNGQDAVDYALADDYDVIVLDIMMPKMNGYEALKEMRKRGLKTPILFLSSKSDVSDKIEGFNLGGDDYLTKPFASAELIARVKALYRRKNVYTGNELYYGDLMLDKDSLVLSSKENKIRLGATEFKIMEILMSNPRNIVNKEHLIQKVWGYDFEGEYNSAEVYVSFLRKKIYALNSIVNITAIRGVGYTLTGGDVLE